MIAAIPWRRAGARTGRARLAASAALLALAALGCASCAARRGAGITQHVAIRGFTFQPAELAVAPGDTVVWVNHDIVPHTATAQDRAWDTGRIGPDSSASVVIGRQGIEPYACAFHPEMKALLTGRAGSPGPESRRRSE